MKKSSIAVLVLGLITNTYLFIYGHTFNINIGNASFHNGEFLFITESATISRMLHYIGRSEISCNETTYCVQSGDNRAYSTNIPINFTLCKDQEFLNECHQYPLTVSIDSRSWMKLGVLRK